MIIIAKSAITYLTRELEILIGIVERRDFATACEKCLDQSDRCRNDEFAAEKTTGAKGGSNGPLTSPCE